MSTTKGSLDLGGASTQITFIPPSNDQLIEHNTEFFKDIRIYGKTYRLYSHSFLCWGAKQISLLYKTYLIKVLI
jgi:Golgi nucleoside diphosphatase